MIQIITMEHAVSPSPVSQHKQKLIEGASDLAYAQHK